ncbi:Alpha-2-macroglobulin, partial [Stegodyphus mimosarum]
MMQLKLPLSEEPTLGTWSIKSLINNVTSVQNFKIEKYVLPKFEVKINSPWYVMDNAETFSTEICAWYTYGKKVDGFLRAKFVAKKRWGKDSFPSVEHIGEISGCHTVVINTTALSFGNFYSPRFKAIEIFAEVVENGTEIRVNKTIEITVVRKPLQLKFLNSVNGKAYIKPRLPYSGAVLLKHLNGTASASVKVRICADFEECLTFISDKNGLIHFTLNPRKTIMSSIELEAEVVDPLYVADFFDRRVTATLTLIPWDSPSDSYLQIE